MIMAHLGHATGTLGFAVPVLVMFAWLTTQSWREKRHERRSAAPATAPSASARVAEVWVLSRRDGRWVVVATQSD